MTQIVYNDSASKIKNSNKLKKKYLRNILFFNKDILDKRTLTSFLMYMSRLWL